MPWSLKSKDGKWCVVKDSDGAEVACHDSRADAIKHQRALYANESRMASLYATLDALPDPEPVVAAVEPAPMMSQVQAEIIALLMREEKERSLVASVAENQELLAQRMQQDQEERMALVAALGRMGSPTIHIPAQAAPEVTVHVPPAEVNFTAPEVNVHVPPAAVTVNSPDVNVTVEAAPPVQKTVTFERDPLTQQVVKAEVTEQ